MQMTLESVHFILIFGNRFKLIYNSEPPPLTGISGDPIWGRGGRGNGYFLELHTDSVIMLGSTKFISQ